MKTYFLLIFPLLFFSCGGAAEKISKSEYQQWHTITLSFEGPMTSENAQENPFLNYRLMVTFKTGDKEYTVSGFYAADGNSAESSSDSGNIWQVRFAPEQQGNWSYSASLYKGENIALSEQFDDVTKIELANATGEFMVIPSNKEGADFRAHGRLVANNGYFQFKDSGKYWIKGGADSPENLLAYTDFDGTYRMETSMDDGEAKTNSTIHSYGPHLNDWKEGDPTWQGAKGKALIGAVNYLSSKGMNAVYFLTNNIKGDGKDVWPYVSPEDFTRFDVSKLDQWEILFQHMQSKGILMHLVFQETENETMLDGGDTGPLRQLYFRELLARFGHHLGMNFNLGEENGPADFSPTAQNDRQRREMTSFITRIDPYNHPILLHTHSHEPARANILDSITGFKDLDGLSLQVDKREGAANVVETWKKASREKGNEWLITMDEIGMWHTGARSDSLDGNHDTLRSYVLWGTLFSGAAGVEWYFGANNFYHDLNTEDWRSRDRLWEITGHALHFFREYLPFWEMQPKHDLINSEEAYCFKKSGKVYAVYLPNSKQYSIDLSETTSDYSLHWFDTLEGGELQIGSVTTIKGGSIIKLGLPPISKSGLSDQDWVALLRVLE